MRTMILLCCMLCRLFPAIAQELYVSTEPASNMATGSIGMRLNSKFFHMLADGSYSCRLDPELMFGLGRKWMGHLNFYASNMYQPQFKAEGGSAYIKYRFYSDDDIHSHFRMAAYGKMSLIDNPSALQKPYIYYTSNINGEVVEHQGIRYYQSDEIDLDGNNSGFLAGIVATKLLSKWAVSSSGYIIHRWDNLNASHAPEQSNVAFNYTLSGGYLLLPRLYKNYHQTNLNLYCEILGSSSLDKKAYFIDVAPAIQFIFNSISRLDISYRTEMAGTMERLSKNYFLLRFEYNLLNVFRNN